MALFHWDKRGKDCDSESAERGRWGGWVSAVLLIHLHFIGLEAKTSQKYLNTQVDKTI